MNVLYHNRYLYNTVKYISLSVDFCSLHANLLIINYGYLIIDICLIHCSIYHCFCFKILTLFFFLTSYLTASKVIVLARGLQRATVDFRRNITTAAAQGVINSLCATLSTRFHKIHANHILADTAALH